MQHYQAQVDNSLRQAARAGETLDTIAMNRVMSSVQQQVDDAAGQRHEAGKIGAAMEK